VGQRFLVHGAAIVADGEQRVLAGDKARVGGAIVLVEGIVSRLDGDLAENGRC